MNKINKYFGKIIKYILNNIKLFFIKQSPNSVKNYILNTLKKDVRKVKLSILFSIFSILVVFVMYSLVKTVLKDDSRRYDENVLHRPDLYDRNGKLLVTSHFIESVYANPSKIDNPEEYAKHLSSIFANLSFNDVLKKLKSNKNFVWIVRNITLYEKEKLLKYKKNYRLKYVDLRSDLMRVYLYGNLFSHVIGYVNIDQVGVMGFERWIDKYAGETIAIENESNRTNHTNQIQLTLDVNVQDVLREQLSLGVQEFDAEWGCAVIAEIETGEVLGLFSYPDFDINSISSADNPEMFNHAVSGVYEFGSIFKIFNLALVVEHAKDMYKQYDVSEDLRISSFIVTDHKKHYGTLNIFEGFVKSSNICYAKSALEIGGEVQKKFLTEIGVFSHPSLEIVEIGKANLPSNWGKATTVTVSYGYGVAVSSIHVLQALINIISYTQPRLTLIRKTKDHMFDGEKIGRFKSNNNKLNSKKVSYHKLNDKQLNSDNVCHDRLSIAKNDSIKLKNHNKIREVVIELLNENMKDWYSHRISQHKFGGKTGTANMLQNGRYILKRNVVSFVGIFPSENPRYIIIIILGAPKPSAKTFGLAYSILFTAPLARNIINILMESSLRDKFCESA